MVKTLIEDRSYRTAGVTANILCFLNATSLKCILNISNEFVGVSRLNRKYDEIRATEQLAEEFMMDDAEYAFVAYGIASRMARSAVDELRRKGMKIGLIRPKTLFPFPENALRKAVKNGVKQFFSVEMSNGQMIDDVRLAIECARPVSLINRMGGNVPTVEEIVNRTMDAIKGGK